MECPKCGKNLEKNWGFCPACGFRIQGNEFVSFDEIFERMHDQMEKMFRQTEKDFEVFDLSPVFREFPTDKKAKGFKITIRSGTGTEPEINVRTFGDVKEEELKKEIYEQLGTAEQKSKHEPAQRATQKPKVQLMGGGYMAEKSPKKELRIPELTEEPKTSIRRLESKVVVDIEIPGVESDENVDIKELENSVEVKAITGDRAYFKILTKPSNFRLSEKKFVKGRLHLEFA